MAIEQFHHYAFSDGEKIDKWDRFGYKIKHKGFNKKVNATQEYDQAYLLIQKFGEPEHDKTLTKNLMEIRFTEVLTHQIGTKVIQIFPPCNTQ